MILPCLSSVVRVRSRWADAEKKMSTTEMVIKRLDEELEELVAQMNIYFRQIKSGKCKSDLITSMTP